MLRLYKSAMFLNNVTQQTDTFEVELKSYHRPVSMLAALRVTFEIFSPAQLSSSITPAELTARFRLGNHSCGRLTGSCHNYFTFF